MRNLFLLLLMVPVFSLSAQQHVYVQIDQKMGDQPFALYQTFTTSETGTPFEPRRLQYYISLPVVIHDGGQETPAPEAYFLIDASAPAMLDLGEMDVQQIEGLRFSIGVDSASNHLDPAQYKPTHPLAYQDPSMHWGWFAGYRFIAYEGKSGNNLLYIFEIHTIGNDLYRTIDLETSANRVGDDLVIELEADYSRLLENIDISGGLYAHGNLGGAEVATENMASLVFKAATTSATSTPGFNGQFAILPNPAPAGQALARMDLPQGHRYHLRITDVYGRECHHLDLAQGLQDQGLPAAAPGLYLISLWQDNALVATEKWVVTP